MTGPSLTVSEGRLTEILDLRFAQFEKHMTEHYVSESRAREIVRDEFGIATRAQWDVRAKLAGIGVLLISVSTFLITLVHGGA